MLSSDLRLLISCGCTGLTVIPLRGREILLQAFADFSRVSELFGRHSLRPGGASSVANAGVSDRLFKRHGRWKTDRAKDGYIKDKLES